MQQKDRFDIALLQANLANHHNADIFRQIAVPVIADRCS
jgi:hypothetical protein